MRGFLSDSSKSDCLAINLELKLVNISDPINLKLDVRLHWISSIQQVFRNMNLESYFLFRTKIYSLCYILIQTGDLFYLNVS